MLLAQNRRLYEAFRDGEKHAMAQVFDHYTPTLARFLERGFMVSSAGGLIRVSGMHSRFELHDTIAETFRRAFEEKARRAYDGVGSYEAYLKTIARRLVVDRLRASATASANVGAMNEATIDRAEAEELRASPETRYQRQECRALVSSFVSTLDESERRFLRWRYDEGLSQEALAERFGWTRRSVRETEEKLRTRLAKHLEGTGYAELHGRGA